MGRLWKSTVVAMLAVSAAMAALTPVAAGAQEADDPSYLRIRIVDEDGQVLEPNYSRPLLIVRNASGSNYGGYWETNADGSATVEVPADTSLLVGVTDEENVITQYYPGVNDPADATWVTVAPGQTLDLGDILFANGSMSGRVVDPEGRPVAGVDVSAVPMNDGFPFYETTGADGRYTGPMPPGTYDVTFRPQSGSGYGPTTVHDVVVDAAVDTVVDAVVPFVGPADYDAQIAPFGGASTATVGVPFTYRWGAGESSPGVGLVVEGTVQPGFELLSATLWPLRLPCTIDGSSYRCELPSPTAVEVTVRPLVEGAASVVDEASVTPYFVDADPSNNTATKVVDVVPAPLAIEGRPNVTTVPVGDQLRYAVTVANPSDADVDSVLVEIPLRAGLDLVSATVGYFSVPCWTESGSVFCSLGRIPSGGSRFVNARFEARTAGQVVIESSVTSSAFSGELTDETTVQVVDGAGTANLAIGLSAPAAVAPGESFSVVALTVGTGGSTDAVITVDAPVGFEVVGAGFGWFGRPCAVAVRTVTCTVGDVDSYQFVVATLRATEGTAAGTVEATVSSRVDVNAADDAASALVSVGT